MTQAAKENTERILEQQQAAGVSDVPKSIDLQSDSLTFKPENTALRPNKLSQAQEVPVEIPNDLMSFGGGPSLLH